MTKQDIIELLKIQALARNEDRARDSEWDKQFHIQVAKATQNSVLVILTEQLWLYRERNPIGANCMNISTTRLSPASCDDYDQILGP